MRRDVRIWVVLIVLLLAGCSQSIDLDLIQESMIGDKFLYVNIFEDTEGMFSDKGTITVDKYSGLLEFYEDNTFSAVRTITKRTYKEEDHSLYYGLFPDKPEFVQYYICDNTEIETGTYELSSYREDGEEKIVVILHITNTKESIRAGKSILQDTEEVSDETRELSITMDGDLIKNIEGYESMKCAENELIQTAIEAIDE